MAQHVGVAGVRADVVLERTRRRVRSCGGSRWHSAACRGTIEDLDAVAPPAGDGAAPFGFPPRDFAADTGRVLLCDPDLVVARTALLDYFREIRRLVPPRNRVFDWEATAADDAAGDGGGALARLLLGPRLSLIHI